MFCPRCNFQDTKVVDSRPIDKTVRRRRECLNCGFRFTTEEELRAFDLYVEKRNGTIVFFNKEKLEYGIKKSFNKRRINEDKLGQIVHKVTEEIIAENKNPIKSTKIGRIVLKNLREVDTAAYICFWAMFGNFENVEDFNKLLKEFQSSL
jgi:transcriptional repressor NrdR